MRSILHTLSEKLDASQGQLATLDRYFAGTQPTAFLAPDAATMLGNRLRALAVNYPALAVRSVAERLKVTGFRTPGSAEADQDLWRIWQANDLEAQSHLAHLDTLVYGRSFVFVWAGEDAPRITVESARQVTADFDPATGEVRAVLKRWQVGDEYRAVLLLPDEIVEYAGPGSAMKVTATNVNPLGEVPVVPLVNAGRLLDFEGVSEMDGIVDLSDALNKIMSDLMVTSEAFARPRRWATGIEIHEDDDGEPINPFADDMKRVWTSEAPDSKFGQFDGARLDGYADAVAIITQQIGAISGLPPHYLGLHGDQPPSADAIRSAEASLVANVYGKQRTLGRRWAKVADLAVKVRDGRPGSDLETVWGAADTRTPAQVADAAAKLAGIGVPLSAVLADPMGYTPAQIETVMTATRSDALARTGLNLSEFLLDEQ